MANWPFSDITPNDIARFAASGQWSKVAKAARLASRKAAGNVESIVEALEEALNMYQDGMPGARQKYLDISKQMIGLTLEQANDVWLDMDHGVATNERGGRLNAQEVLIPVLKKMGYWNTQEGRLKYSEELTDSQSQVPKQASRKVYRKANSEAAQIKSELNKFDNTTGSSAQPAHWIVDEVLPKNEGWEIHFSEYNTGDEYGDGEEEFKNVKLVLEPKENGWTCHHFDGRQIDLQEKDPVDAVLSVIS